MSTTLVTSRRQQSATTSTSSRRQPATSSTSRSPTATASTTTTTSSPKATSQSSLESNSAFDQIETPVSSPSTAEPSIQPSSIYTSTAPIPTCSTTSECSGDRICSDGKCVTLDSASLFGGADSNPTSKLTTGSAVGVGIGLVVVMMLLVTIAFWIWRCRGKRPRKWSVEARMPVTLSRTPSNATDQKTLVASMPNSPQNAVFGATNTMTPGLFARVVAPQEIKEVGLRRSVSTNKKALPLLPLPQLPLPPIPKETKVYAINVSINKSMIMDEDMMQAVSPMRGNDTPRSSTPRDRAPRYKFEEYVPPVNNALPPTSISQAPVVNRNSSEYELRQYPKRQLDDDLLSVASSNGGSVPSSPFVETFPTSNSEECQTLSLPDLPPPSPSFSFRSYEWYQDIIEDPSNGDPSMLRSPARTSTQSMIPKPLFLFPKNKAIIMDPSPSLEPPSPASPGMHLHPNSAAMLSPTSPHFRLSPTVYTPPPRQPQQSVQKRITPPLASARVSALSVASQSTRESRSWVPAEGLYLADEGGLTRYLTFRRGDENHRPTSYSPLT
ncbi:hypothetical protein yc1106_06483 [Curvularia clavata]|uniref:Uncharacterized protein n=1 Tax=Curvularia clavata TaxID=95742 RepID=A0A9Q9DUW2_CURCL|nr:hypothetical protein yc1106_06483 [Curvularia clavata]